MGLIGPIDRCAPLEHGHALMACSKVYQALLYMAPDEGTTAAVKRYYARLQATEETQNVLVQMVNALSRVVWWQDWDWFIREMF